MLRSENHHPQGPSTGLLLRASVLFLLVVSSISTPGNTTEKRQLTRQELYDFGTAAEQRGDLSNAYSYNSVACGIEDADSLEALRASACSRTIELGSHQGTLPREYSWFQQWCNKGSSLGCFFTAQIEAKRGNLVKAVARMSDLCERGFSVPGATGYEACEHLEHLKRELQAIGPENAAEERDLSFQELYDLGQAAEKNGDSKTAFLYNARACLTDAPDPLVVLRITSCSHAVKLSSSVDGYESAHAFFMPRCDEGSDLACFFTAQSAAKKGDLQEAVNRMAVLCARGFHWPALSGYDACEHHERLTLELRATDPRFFTRIDFQQAQNVLLVTILCVGSLFLKRGLFRKFAYVWVLVVLAPALFIAVGRWIPGLGVTLFVFVIFYFALPAIVFGEPHFEFGMGAGPADTTGFILIAAFYTLVAVLITLLREADSLRRAGRSVPVPSAQEGHDAHPGGTGESLSS